MIDDFYLSGVPRRVGGDNKEETRKVAIRRTKFRLPGVADKRGASLRNLFPAWSVSMNLISTASARNCPG